MISVTSPILYCFLLAGVFSMPYHDSFIRLPRTAGYSSSGSSANAGASATAFSSAGTSVFPGPGGAGSFNAKADLGRISHHFPSFIGSGSGTYAGNYDYGTHNAAHLGSSQFGSTGIGTPPFRGSGGSQGGFGQGGYGGGIGVGSSGYGSGGCGYSSCGYGGHGSGGYGSGGYGSGGYGSGGYGSSGYGGVGYGSGGYGSGFGGGGFGSFPSGGFGSGTYSGTSGAFSSAGTGGGFPNFGFGGFSGNFPPFVPFDFNSFMQQHFNNAAAHADAIRKQVEAQAQAHGGSISSNDVGGVGASASGQYSPQGGYGSANVYPAPEGGLDVRFGGDDRDSQTAPAPSSGPVSSVSGSFPPPSGTFHGISTFSSSGQTDVDGKKTSYKTSSVSVNDNGKVTTYTAHDP